MAVVVSWSALVDYYQLQFNHQQQPLVFLPLPDEFYQLKYLYSSIKLKID